AAGDLLAQAVDVDLDRIRADLAVVAVDALDELLLADDLPQALQQGLEQRRLVLRELQRALADAGDALHGVGVEPGGGDGRIGRALAPAQQRTYAGVELLERKRLDQVVVGAQVQALDLVARRLAAGQDQDRNATI